MPYAAGGQALQEGYHWPAYTGNGAWYGNDTRPPLRVKNHIGNIAHQEHYTVLPRDPGSLTSVNQTVVFNQCSFSDPIMDAQVQARCALFKLENADLKAENSQLRSQLALQTTRTRNEKHKNSKLTKENAQATAHAERQEQRYLKWKGVASTAQRKAARAEESRKNPEKRVSVSADGTPRPVHRVQAAEGGKRMALDEVTTTTQGSFECRDMGGLKYRKNEIAFAMQSDVEEGIGSRANRNKREQSNAYRRAAEEGASVAVVQAPRPGCKFRRKAPGVAVAAYDRPSNATRIPPQRETAA